MKKQINFLEKVVLLLSFTSVLIACSSGLQQLKRGNFDEAIFNAVNRLQQNPENQKALSVIRESYPLAINNHKRAIRMFENSQEPFHWEKALAEYQALNKIYEIVSRSSVSMSEVGVPQFYTNELETARQLAADERYQAGEIALLHKQNRLAAKDALVQFERVNQLIPNYKAANKKAEEAFQYAVYRVLIEPVYDVFRLDRNEYNALQGSFDREIFRTKMSNPFVRYHTKSTARQDSLPQNDVVNFALVNLSSPSVNVEKTIEHFSREIRTGTKKINDSTKVDIFETVKGTIITFRKKVVVNGRMEMKVFDYKTNQLLNQEVRNETYSWRDSWQIFEGNPKALGEGKSCPPTYGSGNLEPSPYLLFSNLSNQFANYFRGRLQTMYQNI